MVKGSTSSYMVPDNISKGHIWWVRNPVEITQKETNLIKKDRPFLILNVEPSYSSFKVNGILLQSRAEYILSRYEHVIDVLPNGKFSIADISKINHWFTTF